MNNIKKILCIITLIGAIAFATAGIIIPPQGVIDGSVLILTAQLLTYSSAVIGLDLKFGKKDINN